MLEVLAPNHKWFRVWETPAVPLPGASVPWSQTNTCRNNSVTRILLSAMDPILYFLTL